MIESRWLIRALVALPAVALAALWSVLAVQDADGQFTFDGVCHATEPLWAWTQGALALLGVVSLLQGVAALLQERAPARAFGVAAAAFVVWCVAKWQLIVTAEMVLCDGQPPSSI